MSRRGSLAGEQQRRAQHHEVAGDQEPADALRPGRRPCRGRPPSSRARCSRSSRRRCRGRGRSRRPRGTRRAGARSRAPPRASRRPRSAARRRRARSRAASRRPRLDGDRARDLPLVDDPREGGGARDLVEARVDEERARAGAAARAASAGRAQARSLLRLVVERQLRRPARPAAPRRGWRRRCRVRAAGARPRGSPRSRSRCSRRPSAFARRSGRLEASRRPCRSRPRAATAHRGSGSCARSRAAARRGRGRRGRAAALACWGLARARRRPAPGRCGRGRSRVRSAAFHAKPAAAPIASMTA